MVIELLGKRGELVIINHHRKALGTVLADERLDNAESLTRAWCADDPCASERIDDINPSLAELTLIIVAHGDIDAVLVFYLFFHLLKALVLKVEAVFQQTIFQILGDVIKSYMNEHRADNRHYKVYPCAAVEREECGIPVTVEDPDGEEHQNGSKGNGINDHLLGIELQMLFVPGADTGDTYHQECHDLTAEHMTVLINIHQFQPAMQIKEDAAPEVQKFWGDSILEELHDQGNVDECTEYLVQRL